MNDRQKATLNFLYFSKNFPYLWEERCFEGNTHLIKKYQEMGKEPMEFIFELGRENQNKLLQWVEDNYLGFTELKIK